MKGRKGSSTSQTRSRQKKEDDTVGDRVPVRSVDVVGGKGRFVVRGPGNIRYEQLLDLYAPKHTSARGGMMISEIQTAIMTQLLPGSRIMTRFDRKTNTAIELSSKGARAKIGQAIRYRNSSRRPIPPVDTSQPLDVNESESGRSEPSLAELRRPEPRHMTKSIAPPQSHRNDVLEDFDPNSKVDPTSHVTETYEFQDNTAQDYNSSMGFVARSRGEPRISLNDSHSILNPYSFLGNQVPVSEHDAAWWQLNRQSLESRTETSAWVAYSHGAPQFIPQQMQITFTRSLSDQGDSTRDERESRIIQRHRHSFPLPSTSWSNFAGNQPAMPQTVDVVTSSIAGRMTEVNQPFPQLEWNNRGATFPSLSNIRGTAPSSRTGTEDSSRGINSGNFTQQAQDAVAPYTSADPHASHFEELLGGINSPGSIPGVQQSPEEDDPDETTLQLKDSGGRESFESTSGELEPLPLDSNEVFDDQF